MFSKGLPLHHLRTLAPRFGPDVDGTSEKKPRHSLDSVEVFSIEARSKLARRWDARWEGYLLTGPKTVLRRFLASVNDTVRIGPTLVQNRGQG